MKKIIASLLALFLLLTIGACTASPVKSAPSASPSPASGDIYLFGEQHGIEIILNKELELWRDCYQNKNMRHLFIEHPYYTAEFLNLWMSSDSNDILNALYDDWADTFSHTPSVKAFYEKIKSDCPETIFHGTDIGHQYESTGARYLKYLEDNQQKDSPQYLAAQAVIEQGKHYIVNSDDVYRENTMTENFIREFDALNGEDVMGIYGAAHTDLNAMDFMTGTVPCMANQLKAYYGDIVHSEDFTSITDIITIGGKEYTASYLRTEDMSSWSKEFISRDFWRLENAYDDLKSYPKTGDWLPYDNYLQPVETGQVFVIDYTKTDGTVLRTYQRSDGAIVEDKPSTEEFKVN